MTTYPNYSTGKSLWVLLLWAGLAYLVIYIFYTWPLITQFFSHIPGETDADVYSYLWDTWRTSEQAAHLVFMKTKRFFAPIGVDLTFLQTVVIPMTLFTLPFENLALGFNIFLLLTYVISGIGGFVLCKRFVNNPLLCFLAGFIFAFSPWKMARIEFHYNLIQTWMVPFYILFLLQAFDFRNSKSFRVQSYKALILWLIAGFLAVISDKVTAVTMGTFTFIFFIWNLIPFLRNFSFTQKHLLGLAVIVVIGHFAIGFLQENFNDKGAFWWGADFLGLVIPWNHLLIAEFLPESFIDEVHKRGLEAVIYLGWTFIITTLIVFWAGRKIQLPSQLKVLFVTGLILMLLTLPEISVLNYKLLNNPLSFFHFIPGIQFFRCPGRFIMPVYLLLSIPVFYLFEKLVLKKFYVLLLIFLLVIEYAPAGIHTLNVTKIPQVYKEVKTLKGQTLLPVPFGIKNGYTGDGDFRKEDMLYQTVHQKNLIGGYAPFGEKVWTYYHSDTVMKTLLQVQRDTSLAKPDFSSQQKNRFFKRFKPDIIVIQPEYRNSNTSAILKNVIQGRSRFKRTINGYLLIRLK